MDLNEYQNQKPLIYDSENDFFSTKVAAFAADSGILSAVESFLNGLPDSVRNKMTAGELADYLLSVIGDLRNKHSRTVKE